MDLDKHKKELEKKKKEINILCSSRNLNLNLNNHNTIIKAFISKTPEGLQHKGRRIILTNNSYLKPYMKKNAILNKSNRSITQDNIKDDELTNSSSNYNKLKINEYGQTGIIKLNKNVSCNDIWKIKEKENKRDNELKEMKENFKNKILKLQKENEALKAENQKIKKNNHKSLNKDKSHNIENKNS